MMAHLNYRRIKMNLSGSKTEQSLKDAFAGESQANRRYLYFANQCDVLGEPDMAALFRSTAEGETGHAHGHMEHLIEGGVGDPGTDMPARKSKICLLVQFMEKHMSTLTCTQVWLKRQEKRDLMKLLIGLKL